jgi:hypothetical protein
MCHAMPPASMVTPPVLLWLTCGGYKARGDCIHHKPPAAAAAAAAVTFVAVLQLRQHSSRHVFGEPQVVQLHTPAAAAAETVIKQQW